MKQPKKPLRSRVRRLYEQLDDPLWKDVKCAVWGCESLASNATGKGLGRHCRKHLLHLRRHGHLTKPSYTAKQINPYRRAAYHYLTIDKLGYSKGHSKGHSQTHPQLHPLGHSKEDLEAISYAIKCITQQMSYLGKRHRNPQDTFYEKADVKALGVWSRLVANEVSPMMVLASAMAVIAKLEHDPDKPYRSTLPEYRDTQIGKLLLRMAGGSIKRWDYDERPNRSPIILRQYTRSEGVVLRHLGRQLKDALEWLPSGFKEDVRELAERNENTPSWQTKAFPSGLHARSWTDGQQRSQGKVDRRKVRQQMALRQSRIHQRPKPNTYKPRTFTVNGAHGVILERKDY